MSPRRRRWPVLAAAGGVFLLGAVLAHGDLALVGIALIVALLVAHSLLTLIERDEARYDLALSLHANRRLAESLVDLRLRTAINGGDWRNRS